ncbi:MAG: DUF6070 family protein [Candidatus Limivicinus sp.]|nr:DUF6070 family protein [Candidatus Limivicinus sp.]
MLLILLLTILWQSCGRSEDGASRGEGVEQAACTAAETYQDLLEDQKPDMERILERLETEGYAAVDMAGDHAFVNPEQVRAFSADKQAGTAQSLVFLRVCLDGGLLYTGFCKEENDWYCQLVRVAWEKGSPVVSYSLRYPLLELRVTEKDYLIFTCDIPDNTAASSHDGYIEPTTMIRLTPLAEDCRRCGELYLEPVGYNYHNLFTTTWTGADMEAVCLNDLYLSLYKAEQGAYISYFNNPYPTDENSGVSHVPGEDFETLLMQYTCLDRERIRAWARYDRETDSYPVCIDGPHDGLAIIPVPEVVDVQRGGDGSLILRVDALLVSQRTDRAFTHLVTIQPSADGSYRIIANQVLEDTDNILPDYESLLP